jgi:hypothetical protein
VSSSAADLVTILAGISMVIANGVPASAFPEK